MPKTNAEYCRDYRRKRKNENKIKKKAKSATERVREFRARQKELLKMKNDSSITHNDDFTVENSESDHNDIPMDISNVEGDAFIENVIVDNDFDETKKKWKNLRDSYGKYLRGEKIKTWQWAQQMEFLKPFLPFSKTKSDSQVQQSLTEELIDDQSSQQTIEMNIPVIEKIQPHIANIPTPIIDDGGGQLKITKDPLQPVLDIGPPQPKKRKLDKPNPQPSAVEQLINYLDKKSIESNNSDIDQIFKGYAITVKQFSKKRQAITKFKIAQIIMEQELEHIEELEQCMPSTSTFYKRPNSSQSSYEESNQPDASPEIKFTTHSSSEHTDTVIKTESMGSWNENNGFNMEISKFSPNESFENN